MLWGHPCMLICAPVTISLSWWSICCIFIHSLEETDATQSISDQATDIGTYP